MKKLIGVLCVATFVVTMSFSSFISKNEINSNDGVNLSSLLSVSSANAESSSGSCSQSSCGGGRRVCCANTSQPHY